MANMTDPKIFENITKPMRYRASYLKRDFTVRWFDGDNSVMKTETVGMHMSATPPTQAPTKPGGTFTGWDKAYDSILANTDILPLFSVNTYTVRWLNWNGTVLKTQQVQHGSSATPPQDPVRDGYTFTGWDKSYSQITGDTDIQALFSQDKVMHKVTFVALLNVTDSRLDKVEISSIEVEEGTTPTMPTPPTQSGYCFYKWQTKPEPVTGPTEHIACYYPDAAPDMYQTSWRLTEDKANILTSSSKVVHSAGDGQGFTVEHDCLLVYFMLKDCRATYNWPYLYTELVEFTASGAGAIVSEYGANSVVRVKFTQTGTATLTAKNKLSGKSKTVTINVTAPQLRYIEPSSQNKYSASVTCYVEGNIAPTERLDSYLNDDRYVEQSAVITGTSSNTSIFKNGVANENTIVFDRVTGATGSATITVNYSSKYLSKKTKSWTVSTKD